MQIDCGFDIREMPNSHLVRILVSLIVLSTKARHSILTVFFFAFLRKDGGGVERWEDPYFRAVWDHILSPPCHWQSHDPYSLGPSGERLLAKTDLYHGPGQCSVFRPFQGWLSMSHTQEKEGTLRVLPLLKETTAYIVLRPFFKPKKMEKPMSSDDPGYSEEFLSPDNWVVSLLLPVSWSVK